MATPFAPFANARLAWQKPTAALTSLRNGTRPAATTTVVIEAFIEPASDAGQKGKASGDSRGESTALGGQSRSLSGYITRWATLPNGADWLDAGTSWTWDDTGLRPEGLTAGQDELQAALVSIADLPATDRAEIGTLVINQLGSPYGPGGIGLQVTAIAGEQISGMFRIP
jgi:hypothetical protein